MLQKESLILAMRDCVGSEIFSRGKQYFTQGNVRSCTMQKIHSGYIITGKVRGSRLYNVEIKLDEMLEDVISSTCSCPYELNCKHMVALALTAADSLQDQTDEQPAKLAEMIETLERMGFNTDRIPNDLLDKLLAYQQSSPLKRAPTRQKLTPKPHKHFDPNNFAISLNRYHEFQPTLYQKRPYRQQADIKKLLAMNGLSEPQRELLVYLRDQNFNHWNAKSPDPAVLFPMLANAGIELSYEYGVDAHNLRIELNPAPLEAQILYCPRISGFEPKKTRHDFVFQMPNIYWKKTDWYGSPFSTHGSCVVHTDNDKNVLSLHVLTPILAKLIERTELVHDYTLLHQPNAQAQTNLTGEEIENYGQVIQDAKRFLRLQTDPPEFTTRSWDQCEPEMLVHFDAASLSLCLKPCINYGSGVIDVSETVYTVNRKYQHGTIRQSPWDQTGSHVISLNGDVIHHAKVNEQKEIDFFTILQSSHQELGFTKKLKGARAGGAKLKRFLTHNWPNVLEHANKHHYAIRFTQDELPKEQARFSADVDLNLNEKEDWLSFDVKCYCSGEQIPLAALLDYIAGRSAFIKRSDGTLVEIENKKELERFANMLNSFHERENGVFEGALHHAPELRYMLTNSEHYNTTQSKAFQALHERMHSGKPVQSVRMNKRYEEILRAYQKEGVEWLYFLRSFHFGGILADEMGLGKTLQTLIVLEKERGKGAPSLVVCPKTLLYNWKEEASKFCPRLKVLLYEGNLAQRKKLRAQFPKFDLIVTGYATLKTDELFLTKKTMKFNYTVLDEAQAIKNPVSKVAQSVKKIHANYRLALTGTPLENNVLELWSIFDFLMPGFLGTHKEFRTKFSRPIMDHGDQETAMHLRRKISCFMLRRTKNQVLSDLPPKIEQTSICSLSDAQNILYQQILAKVRSDILDVVNKKGFSQSQIHILAALTKLRQACNHPALLLTQKKWNAYESAKLDVCLELVDEIVESGRKVLVFSQFTSMLEILRDALDEKKIRYAYLSGMTRKRQEVVDSFQSQKDIQVFLISLKTGGVGLNLTAADTVIIFDPWWNPSVENQAVDRTHRIGQDRPVHVHRLMTTGTIEEKIQALKEKKQGLFNAMVGESKDLFQKLTWDDVKGLFEIEPSE